MKNSKKLVAALLAVGVLAACGQKEDDTVEQPVEEQEVKKIDVSKEAEQFKVFASSQMEDFVKDAELLSAHVKEGKLEEAQKLFPLVAMYYERMQPIVPNFVEQDKAINGPLTVGKESEGTGFQRLAYGLFQEKTTKGYENVAAQLVFDIKSLQQTLVATDISDNNVLASAITKMDLLVNERLTATSIANNEVYIIKAQTETAEELIKIFMQRVTPESAVAATEAIATLNNAVEYYEVGKEDYVNYSFFTSNQKEELETAVTAVQTALEKMNETIK